MVSGSDVMSLSPFELAWLVVACGCLVAGTWLTNRRTPHIRERQMPQVRRCRCGQLPGTRDRFCGGCGRRVEQQARERHMSHEA
jgi:predicted nucleic acid-binding Zn ribbon protein